MLAMADSKGVVEGSVPGLADAARQPLEKCIEALNKLRSPDEWSRDSDNEGRRIEDIPGGWIVLNYMKYREPTSTERVRKHRKHKRNNETVSPVSKRCVTHETVETPPDPDPDPEEDKNKNPPLPPQGGTRAKAKRVTQMPDDWVPSVRHKELSIELGVDLKREEEHFRDYCLANGKTYKDWNAGFRTWLRNAKTFKRGPQNDGLTKGQREFNAQMDFLKDEMRKCEEGNDR